MNKERERMQVEVSHDVQTPRCSLKFGKFKNFPLQLDGRNDHGRSAIVTTAPAGWVFY